MARANSAVLQPLPLLDEILAEWGSTLGADLVGYKHHVYRMVHSCFALKPCSEEEREKIIIAGAFHDLGVWSADTLDYLAPSAEAATDYLKQNGRDAWSTEIELMITLHHQLRRYRDPAYPLVELFRRGDLVDASRGLCRFGLSRAWIREVKRQYPHAGFWRSGYKKLGRWVLRHPLRPLPMFRW